MSEWREYNLGEIAEVVPGYAFKGKDFTNNGVPIVKIGNINPPLVNLSECQKIAPEKVIGLGKFKLTKGDFVLAMTGATIGKVGRYVSEEIGYLNQRVAKFNERPGISDKRFLYHLITSHKVSSEIINRGLGSAQPNVSGRDIESIIVDIPPLPTQKAIAEILSSLDDKIELNNQINQNLEALAQALFKQWFVDFEFPNENREPYKSSGGEMIDSELGEIPKGWRVEKFGNISDLKGGGTPSTKESSFWDGEIFWSSPKDLSNLDCPVLFSTEKRITPEGLKKISSGLLPKGTLLLSSRAPIGYLAICQIETAINQGYIAINAHSPLDNIFILNWLKLNMDKVIEKANGSTFLEVSKTNFRDIKIVIPSDETLSRFSNQSQAFFEQITINAKESIELKTLRDTLLPKLISGELEVSEASLEPTF